jgi:hypothetical protein
MRPTPPPTKGAAIPAPTWGWDASSQIANMEPDHAIVMDNWFPQTESVEVRRGYGVQANTGSGLPVESLMAYQGQASDAMFAATDGYLYEVSSGTAGAPYGPFLNTRFQSVNFSTTGGDFLWICNGAEDPRYFDGSSWTTAVITGAITGTDVVNVLAHKGRLWLCATDSLSAYYLNIDSISGPATAFDLQGVFTMGGYLTAIGSWTLDGGNGPDDYIAFITSRGEVVVYSGIDPDAGGDFTQVARTTIGAPIGNRCLLQVGSDLAIISIDGVLPLSKAITFDRAALANVALTTRIQRAMNLAARAYGDNFGWQLIGYPRGTRALLNVPIIEGEQQEQYVMNTITGAWCRFTGQNASVWELLNDRLYFGGNNGVVYEADIGGADIDASVTADLRTAFNFFEDRASKKKFTGARPNVTTDGTSSPGIAINVDYREDALLTVPQSAASPDALWDIAEWDLALWPPGTRIQQNWQTVVGVGTCASARMSVTLQGADLSMMWDDLVWEEMTWDALSNAPIQLALNGFDIRYQSGGLQP